jgi:pyruvate dehydrogenase kinase 2/3/4
MQLLPYVVVTNPHFSEVYDLYYTAFDAFRKVKEIRNLDDNDRFCKVIIDMLRQHVTVIPKLAKGVLECDGMMEADDMDKFMNTILRSVSHTFLRRWKPYWANAMTREFPVASLQSSICH